MKNGRLFFPRVLTLVQAANESYLFSKPAERARHSTSSNCTLSAPVLAYGSAPRVPALSAIRPLKQGIPLKTVLVGLASLQPCFGGIYSARLQARLETKSRATKGARLRLKTYVMRHAPGYSLFPVYRKLKESHFYRNAQSLCQGWPQILLFLKRRKTSGTHAYSC